MDFIISGNICLTRIHAHICGDGHLYIEKGGRGKRYVIEYTNHCIELINSFSNDVYCILGKKPFIVSPRKKNVYVARIRSKYLYSLLKHLDANNSRSWRASAFIEMGSRVLINWLSAFIDDEGYIDTQKYRIVINSVNYYGLLDIHKMLESLNIDSKIYNYSNLWGFCRLIVGKRENVCRLYSMLELHHPGKKKMLAKICDNF